MNAFQLESNATIAHLRLEGDVTIEVARDLHKALVSTLPSSTLLQVHAGSAERVDAAILQLLVAAKAGVRLDVVAVSPGWIRALQRLGVEAELRSSKQP